MIGGKKVIGVCLTQIQDKTRADFVNRLCTACGHSGFKLIVFNSVVDFYNNDLYDEGAYSIYKLINYDVIDALIVLSDNFHDRRKYKEIIGKAKEKGVPVVVTETVEEGCCSIVKEYREAYKSVIRHLIKEHGYTDTFFMAGKKENDEDSVIRIQCYKEVLEENGLAFSDDMVGYGDYWSLPAKNVLEELIRKRKAPPRAIICANDLMAMAVCEKLAEMGYNVPTDVAVTGFDGIPDADYFYPKLTTCRVDTDGLAEMCISTIKDAFDGKEIVGVKTQTYLPSLHNSCGCADPNETPQRDAAYLFHSLQQMENHENYMYSQLDKLIECSDISKMGYRLSKTITPGSYICLRSDFITSAISQENKDDGKKPPDKLLVIPRYGDKTAKMLSEISVDKIIPDTEQWAKDNTVYVLTAVFVGDKAYGYYASKSADLLNSAHNIDRVSKVINITLSSVLDHMRQKFMSLSIESAQLKNPVTELPNLKGANQWFDEFSSDPENHDLVLAVSVYTLPKYKYIYENYGIKDIEEVLRLTAESLKLANNTDGCYIAHIAESEFIVINFFPDGNEIARVINNATSIFFTTIENYNNNTSKEYYVEVNCGCTVVDPGWDGTLANYTKLASIELYANRIKNGMGAAIKDESPQNDFYQVFNILVNNNLFLYHFQPIVNAKNGEIYAYEALMRTDSSIGMTPLQVLDTAKSYKRLYEIEKATMLNVMDRFSEGFEEFGGRKVFINSIPGYFLTPYDVKTFSEKYAQYTKYFVFEITEQNSISDEELSAMKNFGGVEGGTQIAIDDYGAGHSNIVNLLRYSPQIIKIDRFLIENINKDVNKQMFVRSTIDFARLNNIKVLAEGVETYDEMITVIDFGVDYIQGFYTGRPSFRPLAQIDPEIKRQIMDANPLFVNSVND